MSVTARSVGSYGDNIDVEVLTNAEDPSIATGLFRIHLIDERDGSLLDASYDLADAAAARNWALGTIVDIEPGVSANDPAAGTFDLVGGADDTQSIGDDDWQTAIDSLSYTLGPGIIFAPGATTGTIYNMLASAALGEFRVAFLDGADSPTASTLIAAVKGIVDTTLKRSRFAGYFVPWLIVPGLTSGTVRKIPPSPAVAGRFAYNMSRGMSANEPAAGENGRLDTVIAFSQTYTDADRQTLNANGINVIRDIYGVSKIYGWRSTADPVNDPKWIALNNSILHRQIVAEAQAVGERFIFRQIDGQGHLVSEFGGALSGEVCMPLFLAGSLYGSNPQEAYKVDVGPSVNTDTTIANNEMHAVISVRMAPFGEEVDIEIVKYLVTETLAA
jgi:phage tail sheath protein FI